MALVFRIRSAGGTVSIWGSATRGREGRIWISNLAQRLSRNPGQSLIFIKFRYDVRRQVLRWQNQQFYHLST